jgi:hypothetical protein
MGDHVIQAISISLLLVGEKGRNLFTTISTELSRRVGCRGDGNPDESGRDSFSTALFAG